MLGLVIVVLVKCFDPSCHKRRAQLKPSKDSKQIWSSSATTEWNDNAVCAKNKYSFNKTLKSLEAAQPFGRTSFPKEQPVQNNTVWSLFRGTAGLCQKKKKKKILIFVSAQEQQIRADP